MARLTEAQTAEFWRGVAWAISQADEEASDLAAIRDGYIEAKISGTHGGRRINRDTASMYARNFGERADALDIFSDHLRSKLDAGRAALEASRHDQ